MPRDAFTLLLDSSWVLLIVLFQHQTSLRELLWAIIPHHNHHYNAQCYVFKRRVTLVDLDLNARKLNVAKGEEELQTTDAIMQNAANMNFIDNTPNESCSWVTVILCVNFDFLSYHTISKCGERNKKMPLFL